MLRALDNAREVGGNHLFSGMTAWFSISCRPTCAERWQECGGDFATTPDEAAFLFSDDANASDTLVLHQSDEYRNRHLIIFKTAWIDRVFEANDKRMASPAEYVLCPESHRRIVDALVSARKKRGSTSNSVEIRQDKAQPNERQNGFGSSRMTGTCKDDEINCSEKIDLTDTDVTPVIMPPPPPPPPPKRRKVSERDEVVENDLNTDNDYHKRNESENGILRNAANFYEKQIKFGFQQECPHIDDFDLNRLELLEFIPSAKKDGICVITLKTDYD